MATEEQITELRQLIGETEDDSSWSDETLNEIIDGTDSMNAAASKVWYLKAGQYAGLVDTTESGSSRKLGDLRKNATEMGALYAGFDQAETAVPVSTSPSVQRIRRTVA